MNTLTVEATIGGAVVSTSTGGSWTVGTYPCHKSVCPNCGVCDHPDYCTHCGICKNCGRFHRPVYIQPIYVPPYIPYPPYIPPYMPSYPIITCGTLNIPASTNTYIYNGNGTNITYTTS